MKDSKILKVSEKARRTLLFIGCPKLALVVGSTREGAQVAACAKALAAAADWTVV